MSGTTNDEVLKKLDVIIAEQRSLSERVSELEGRVAPTNNGSFGNADVISALSDVREVHRRLQAHVDSSQDWNAPDVGIACYLFNFMLEVGWYSLVHAATKQKPAAFCKPGVTRDAWPLLTLTHQGAKYGVPKFMIGLPQKAKDLLAQTMEAWMPYRDSDRTTTTYFYNKIGFWLHALRFIRNCSTHRSLGIVVPPTPQPSNSDSQTSPSGSPLQVMVPTNPALAEYNDAHVSRSLAFGTELLCHTYSVTGAGGYTRLDAVTMASDMMLVANVVSNTLDALLTACM